MSRTVFYFSSIFFCLLISCTKTQNSEDRNNEARELRTSLVTGKSSEEIREIFNSASFKTKQELWMDKMDYLLEQDLSDEIKHNIEIVRDFIWDFGNKDKYENFNEAVIRLAELVPSEDFFLMFESLNNYDYSGSFVGKNKVSEDFINHITSLKTSYYIGGGSDLLVARKCTCRWCWIEMTISSTSSNCSETDRGCGFLFLQRCNKTLN